MRGLANISSMSKTYHEMSQYVAASYSTDKVLKKCGMLAALRLRFLMLLGTWEGARDFHG